MSIEQYKKRFWELHKLKRRSSSQNYEYASIALILVRHEWSLTPSCFFKAS